MNYMSKIAEMLGVELGERFKAKNLCNDNVLEGTYFFDEYGLKYTIGGRNFKSCCMNEFFIGVKEIIKLPWKPKDRENYYYICLDVTDDADPVADAVFDITCGCDLLNYHIGNCFKSKAEAEKHRDEILAEFNKISRELEG